jgi:hypothetical protein
MRLCRSWQEDHSLSWHFISERRSLQFTVPNPEIGNWQIVYYLLSTGAGASAGVGVAAGAGVAVLGADSGAFVAVGSSALLQPANNAKVTKPVAIIALVFIVVSYLFQVFVWGFFT